MKLMVKIARGRHNRDVSKHERLNDQTYLEPGTHPGRLMLTPDTQSSCGYVPCSLGGNRLSTYSTCNVLSISPPRLFLTYASRLPRNNSPSTIKSKGIGALGLSTLLIREES